MFDGGIVQSNDKLCLPNEAGLILGLSSSGVRHAERRGDLPSIRTVGGVRLYPLEAVLKLKRRRNAWTRSLR